MSLMLMTPAMATQVYQAITVNGTGSIFQGFVNEEMIYEQVIYIDGEAYLNITYEDGSNRIMELEDYVASKEAQWTTDGRGISMLDVAQALDKAARYKLGEADTLTDNERAILASIEAISGSNIDEFYAATIAPMGRTIEGQQKQITQNTYEIEALYRTLEKTDPEVYCQSRMEIVKKYNLPSVKCGLHSKRCYNGEIYLQEGGKDFCVHTEDYIDYLPCYNTLGRCGRVDKIDILDSEEKSYTPIKVTFTNPGLMALKPKLTIEIQEEYSYESLKTYEQELGEVLEGETKTFIVYFDNTGLAPGRNYKMITTVSSGRKDVLETFDYSLKPEGTFEKVGKLEVKYSEPGYKKEMEIAGAYTNLADYPYSVVMTAEIFLEGKRYAETRSDALAVKPGESKEITLAYKPDLEGNYTVLVKVEKTTLKEMVIFTVEKPSLTGIFISAITKVPEGQEPIAFSEENIRENGMTLALGAFALLVSVISTALYWRKSSASSNSKPEVV
ncbi:MAG: hypothetical protein JW727_00195 [Candidatus Aenigmarchaeota archaeon]|nr:hypothetical protein [Candidatus Aenigmarchaeota archaeon]